jgi:SAM-dependent methyltransferase
VSSPPRLDWGLGHYEKTAAQLLPAARVAVDRAAPAEGERVVDVGCGTGNASLLAAARGARVTGVDPAERLLAVARTLAEERGLDATFVSGEAAALPVGDCEADLVLSVFGVIFASYPVAAAAELARVAGPAGRIVLTAWIPGGAVSELARASRQAVMDALGAPPGPPPFAWHDRDALARLFAPHGFEVAIAEESIAFTGSSPRDYLEAEFDAHPLWSAGRAVLEPLGRMEALREQALAILERGNEDPHALRLTSRYVVATARPAAGPGPLRGRVDVADQVDLEAGGDDEVAVARAAPVGQEAGCAVDDDGLSR